MTEELTTATLHERLYVLYSFCSPNKDIETEADTADKVEVQSYYDS